LFNLLHNAVKYTDEGMIRISAVRRDGQTAEVRVEDTGIGIAEEDLPNIFAPYEQARQHGRGGFGLGLGICKQLVELHGGAIFASSRQGEGSVFGFTLPFAVENTADAAAGTAIFSNFEDRPQPAARELSDPGDEARDAGTPPLSNSRGATQTDGAPAHIAPAASEAAVSGEAGGQAPKILLVEDDAVNLNVLAETLKADGYAITCVTGGRQALEAARRQRFDLVIADVMMPGMSGYELTRQLREQFSMSELPILLLTARVRTEDIITGFRAGANDYVGKPADAWELRARVRSLIELKASFHERLRLESAWLQSQIQPHFLYNTLNSIAALGVTDVEKMQTLLHEFSNYLRLSFDFRNASPLVDLEHELSLVRSYLYIERERFGDMIKAEWKVEEGLRVQVPPLSVQPLVENAVKHGLMPSGRGGTITITICRQGENAVIEVKDDGAGMGKEEIERLFSAASRDEPTSHVGLINIERRLRQLFRSGLQIESEPERGTVVRFSVPIGAAEAAAGD